MARSEFDEPHAISKLGRPFSAHGERKPCLTAAARAGQRDEARGCKQPAHFGDFAFAANKAAELQREVITSSARHSPGLYPYSNPFLRRRSLPKRLRCRQATVNPSR